MYTLLTLQLYEWVKLDFAWKDLHKMNYCILQINIYVREDRGNSFVYKGNFPVFNFVNERYVNIAVNER